MDEDRSESIDKNEFMNSFIKKLIDKRNFEKLSESIIEN